MTVNGSLGSGRMAKLTEHNARLMHTYDLARRTYAGRGAGERACTQRRLYACPTCLRFNLRGATAAAGSVHYACNRGKEDQRVLPSNEGRK